MVAKHPYRIQALTDFKLLERFSPAHLLKIHILLLVILSRKWYNLLDY